LVLLDESGLLLAPLVRRSLAPRGQTPSFVQWAGHRDKLSLLAVLTLSPKIQRLGLYFSGLTNQSFDNEAVAYFLRQLLRHLRGPVVVVWDRGPMHRGPALRRLQADHPRLHLESLPPYAPELNPVEQLWTHLKWGRLCNWAPADVGTLTERAYRELHQLRTNHKQLRSYWAASDLPLPRALAS
jgi:transposase